MKRTLTLIMICLAIKANAQNLKSTSDDYDGGLITYQYYDDTNTSEQIKHGNFKFVKTLKGDFGSYSQIVIGKFKDGYRDGAWNFTITQVDFPNAYGSYTTGKTTSIQTFKEGMPNGLWQVNSSWKTRSRSYRIWKPFGLTQSEVAATNFKNGYAIGTTTYNKPKMTTINLNSEGFLTGSYIFPDSYENTEISFSPKGVVKNVVSRNKSGKINEKINFDPELLLLADKYLSNQISKTELDDNHIRIDTINAKNYLQLNNFFESDLFILPTLGGDKTYDGSSSSSKRVYGRYILAERVKVIPYKQHPDWRSDYSDPHERISTYQHFLDKYSAEISREDRKIITDLIKKLSVSLEENQ